MTIFEKEDFVTLKGCRDRTYMRNVYILRSRIQGSPDEWLMQSMDATAQKHVASEDDFDFLQKGEDWLANRYGVVSLLPGPVSLDAQKYTLEHDVSAAHFAEAKRLYLSADGPDKCIQVIAYLLHCTDWKPA